MNIPAIAAPAPELLELLEQPEAVATDGPTAIEAFGPPLEIRIMSHTTVGFHVYSIIDIQVTGSDGYVQLCPSMRYMPEGRATIYFRPGDPKRSDPRVYTARSRGSVAHSLALVDADILAVFCHLVAGVEKMVSVTRCGPQKAQVVVANLPGADPMVAIKEIEVALREAYASGAPGCQLTFTVDSIQHP